MNKNSSLILLGAMTAALLAGIPAPAADSKTPGSGKSISEQAQSVQEEASGFAVQPSPGITDSDLAERVRRTLESYTDITVDARNGVVNISGRVRTGSERSDILKRVGSVQGVRSITDAITVSDSESSGVGGFIDDTSITTVVKGKFLGQSGLDSMDISVETNGGVVTLTGEVENQAQVGLAEGVAKGADGVKDVINHLTYKQ